MANIILNRNYRKLQTNQPVEVLDEDVPEALYQFASRIDWINLFGLEHRFAIRLSTDKRLSVNQQFATLRIKDAIADTFNRAFGARPDVDAKQPDFQIFATANHKFAEIFLDLSGVSLHRRGYRVANTAAPLKENLAAALLYECGWHQGIHDAIIDPMCGSGTFITEALLMRADYPVGLERQLMNLDFIAGSIMMINCGMRWCPMPHSDFMRVYHICKTTFDSDCLRCRCLCGTGLP